MFKFPDVGLVREAVRQRGFVAVRESLERDTLRRLRDQAGRLTESQGTLIERDAEDEQRLHYCVVPGDRIERDMPLLAALYASTELLDWIRAATSNPAVTTSPYMRSALNINRLSRAGQAYPWHADAVPYTVVMFLTSLPTGAGGELQIRSLDGARCPHAVAALREDVVRLTVPMVYPAVHHERPVGLDDFLYGDAIEAAEATR